MKTVIGLSSAIVTRWNASDAKQFHEVLNQPGVCETPVSLEEAAGRIKLYEERFVTHGLSRWAVRSKDGSELLGYAGFAPATIIGRPDRFEIGARLTPAAQGTGIATELANFCCHIALETFNQPEIFAFHVEGLYGRNADGRSRVPRFLAHYEHLEQQLDGNGEPLELYRMTADNFKSLVAQGLAPSDFPVNRGSAGKSTQLDFA